MPPLTRRLPLARWLARLGLIALALVVTELGFRGVLWQRGRAYDSSATAERIRAHANELSGRTLLEMNPRQRRRGQVEPDVTGRVPHPYFGWQTRLDRSRLEGYLRDQESLTQDAFVIWVVGGSVAGMFVNRSAGVERLRELLASDGRLESRTVVVNSLGMASFKQPQQLMVVSYLLSIGLRADAIINIDGFNEVAFGMVNAEHGSHSLYPAIQQWGAVAIPPDSDVHLAEAHADLLGFLGKSRRLGALVLDNDLQRSALVGWASERLLRGYVRKSKLLRARYHSAILGLGGQDILRGPRMPEDGPSDMERIVESWVQSSVSLHGLCEMRNTVYLHVLQPTQHDVGSKQLTAEEVATGDLDDTWESGVRTGYPALRLAGGRLREAGVPFVDASHVFQDSSETLYLDGCHFNDTGNRILASALAPALLALLP